jgi:hypothetical protein
LARLPELSQDVENVIDSHEAVPVHIGRAGNQTPKFSKGHQNITDFNHAIAVKVTAACGLATPIV